MENKYLEWCEIMKQKPNTRDEIVFNAGREFYLISKNTTYNSSYAKCLAIAREIQIEMGSNLNHKIMADIIHKHFA